jgi:cystathionine beta-lyase/cystathionine gamma-synthase
MSAPSPSQRFETLCIHTGVDKDSTFNSCITPIYPTSTFRWEGIGQTKGFDYTRSGNPTRRALEENLAAIEGGIDCRATCTGMSAITAVMHFFKPGDHIVAGHDIYGGTYRLFASLFTDMGIQFSFVNMLDLENVRRAITPATKCVWIETPSNPLLNIVDIAGIVDIARAAKVMTIADNTFLSPYFQRPLDLGVDVVVHSTTKYLNGHSDVVGGAVIAKTKEHADRVGYVVNALGLACSPFDAWLVLRGVKTLGPRMEAHQRGALALARMLAAHPAVERVYYPGLEDRARQKADVGLRRDAELRCEGRPREGREGHARPETVRDGGVPGGRGKPDRTPRHDEPPLDDAGSAEGGGDQRADAARVGGDRASGGFDGRHARGAGGVTHRSALRTTSLAWSGTPNCLYADGPDAVLSVRAA